MNKTEDLIVDQVRKASDVERHLQSGLLSIITAAVIGVFVFLWNLNARFAKMEERDQQRSVMFDRMQSDMNTMRLDMQQLKERMARVEEKQIDNSKQH